MSAGHSPLEQFKIKYFSQFEDIAGMNLNFSNASLFMLLATLLSVGLLSYGIRRRALVPSRFQSFTELTYEFVANMIKDNVGVEGKRYFPLIFSLFIFVAFCNLLGLMPYSFTVTSHIAVTFALAAFIFLFVTVLAIVKHGTKFFGFFLPEGTPWWLAPLMIFIELFAYMARPVSLSVRLAANMLAGHTMLKVIAGFVIGLGWSLGWAPFIFLIVLNGFETFVALLQAYIFAILTCVYLNDAIHLH